MSSGHSKSYYAELAQRHFFPGASPHCAVLLAFPVIEAALAEFFPPDAADTACRRIGFFRLVLGFLLFYFCINFLLWHFC